LHKVLKSKNGLRENIFIGWTKEISYKLPLHDLKMDLCLFNQGESFSKIY